MTSGDWKRKETLRMRDKVQSINKDDEVEFMTITSALVIVLTESHRKRLTCVPLWKLSWILVNGHLSC